MAFYRYVQKNPGRLRVSVQAEERMLRAEAGIRHMNYKPGKTVADEEGGVQAVRQEMQSHTLFFEAKRWLSISLQAERPG